MTNVAMPRNQALDRGSIVELWIRFDENFGKL